MNGNELHTMAIQIDEAMKRSGSTTWELGPIQSRRRDVKQYELRMKELCKQWMDESDAVGVKVKTLKDAAEVLGNSSLDHEITPLQKQQITLLQCVLELRQTMITMQLEDALDKAASEFMPEKKT